MTLTSFPEPNPALAPTDDLLFNTRNRKGKYLQRLMLDITHLLLPSAQEQRDGDYSQSRLRYARNVCEVTSHTYEEGATDTGPSDQDKDRLTLLSVALQRQLFRLTGATGFELTTWTNSLLTQPVTLALLSHGGLRVDLFNPTSSANRNYRGLVELSDEMDEVLSSVHREDADLDRFFVQAASRLWFSRTQSAHSLTSAPLALHTSKTEWSAGELDVDRAEASLCDDVPEVLRRLERYEALLVNSTATQTARWGQDETLAVERTEKRAANLNPDVVTDLAPLSRSMKETTPEELMQLATKQPLTHLAIEFGISEAALRKRLKKAGWVSPRGWGRKSA